VYEGVRFDVHRAVSGAGGVVARVFGFAQRTGFHFSVTFSDCGALVALMLGFMVFHPWRKNKDAPRVAEANDGSSKGTFVPIGQVTALPLFCCITEFLPA
jgi:hypothetical protein